ncbi:MAG: gamma-glutamylcyclotransferase [Hyphomicrobiaceae bacterium]
MTDLLFVYGTLMASDTTAIGIPMRARLQREARSLGAATAQGRLYTLGGYPGMTGSDEPGDVVHGEVYRLAQAGPTLAWLDEYEGISRGATSAGAPDEYRRAETDVRLTDGTVLRCWVYFYQKALPAGARIGDGRWQGV